MSTLASGCVSAANLADIRSKFFPAMPDGVFFDWLAEFIVEYGWPYSKETETTHGTDFGEVLFGERLQYWRDLQWAPLRMPLDEIVLDERSEELAELIVCHVNGLPAFKRPTENINERFARAFRFINEFHRLPKPIVAVIQNDTTWRVADGHHRLAAASVVNDEFPVMIDVWLGIPQAFK